LRISLKPFWSEIDIKMLGFHCRTSIRQIIDKRIGLEAFTDKLTQVTKTENYTRAIKKPHINYKQAGEVFFDYEFAKLFKTLERKLGQLVISL